MNKPIIPLYIRVSTEAGTPRFTQQEVIAEFKKSNVVLDNSTSDAKNLLRRVSDGKIIGEILC